MLWNKMLELSVATAKGLGLIFLVLLIAVGLPFATACGLTVLICAVKGIEFNWFLAVGLAVFFIIAMEYVMDRL